MSVLDQKGSLKKKLLLFQNWGISENIEVEFK